MPDSNKPEGTQAEVMPKPAPPPTPPLRPKEEEVKEVLKPRYEIVDIKDGDFSNFKELSAKSIEKFMARNITSLFPIQYKTFYPVY